MYTCIHSKAFLLCLIKSWERTSKKKREREIGKHKLNEMGALNMKQNVKQARYKSKRSHIVQLFLNMAAH